MQKQPLSADTKIYGYIIKETIYKNPNFDVKHLKCSWKHPLNNKSTTKAMCGHEILILVTQHLKIKVLPKQVLQSDDIETLF